MDSLPQTENSVINYPLSCRSKTKSNLCPSMESYATTTLMFQKVHTEIIKLIHMHFLKRLD